MDKTVTPGYSMMKDVLLITYVVISILGEEKLLISKRISLYSTIGELVMMRNLCIKWAYKIIGPLKICATTYQNSHLIDST